MGVPDRFPTVIRPMLAVAATAPSDRENYAYEFKWDGYRAIASWDGRALRLASRNQQDLTPDYPALARLGPALAKLGPTILDGEIVIFDENGRPDFNSLQNAH